MRRSLYVRHDRAFLAVALVLVVIGFVSWWWLQNRTDHGVARTTSTCGQVDRLYRVVEQMMRDDAKLPSKALELEAMYRQHAARLAAQGCR